ncbi:MAG: MarC family protein [bacterium]|nr:MarC family protein [bacterium]
MGIEKIISIFVIQFWALFLTIDPIGVTPIFISLTSKCTELQRKNIANKGVLIAFLILIFFALTGSLLLDLFGISIAAFRLGGGLLLLLLSIEMVMSKTENAPQDEETSTDLAVFPISIPLLSGPAAITMLILFIKQSEGELLPKAIVLTALFVNMFIVWLCLRFSSKISGLMGKTGANVITKIFGILLTALAFQFIIDGIFEAIKLH